ncbi:MAG TPA: phage holin family protein [Micromonosporaceae bacterium]
MSDPGSESVGELLAEVAGDLSRLFRQEIELAKAELKAEAVKAGKAGGLLAAAGFAGYLVTVLLSLALVAALSEVMPPGWAAVSVAVLWAVAGAVLYAAGRRRMVTVSPVPQQTVETIKEDAQWLRNQTR